MPQPVEARLPHRATPMRRLRLDRQRADQARVTQAYPHEGIYGYTTPPSIVMNR